MDALIKKTICLNMIVKNESSIIIETLKNLCNYIIFDYWVISDTGSTDNTKELICDFFKDKGIVGELVEHEWKDFGYNRTKALKCAFNKTDYLLIFDADDKLEGNFILPKLMDKDSYGLKFGKDFTYHRTLIVNNRINWIYKGVLHEYIQCIDVNVSIKTSNIIDGDYYVVSGRLGNRSKNPNKYLDDARILHKAFDKEMNDVNGDKGIAGRYAFYCAQSYKDSGIMYTTDAIEWYKKVLTLNNWVQEKYYACLKIGELCNSLNKTDEAILYWIRSSEYDNERIEGIVNAMECLRLTNKHIQVNELYHKFKNYNKNVSNDKLFVDKTKYNDLIEYNNSISAFYVPGEKQSGYECCKKIITNNTINPILMESTLKNIIFYKDFVEQIISSDAKIYTTYILKNTTEPISQLITKPSTIEPSELITPRFSKNECRKSKNILFYTGFSNENWNYSYMRNNPLGGSEKAVAYLTKLFPKEYTIYISGGVENEHFDNITYIHLNELQNVINTTAFHTIICSRYISFLEIFTDLSFYKFFIWAHDTSLLPYGCKLTSQQIITKWNKYIDGCICQTNWHANEYKKLYPELTDKINIINNGIDTSLFTVNTTNDFRHKRTNKFIYTSCSERGLFVLLKMWPTILENFSDASLVISSYNNFPKNNDDIEMKKIIDNYPNSITHLGKLTSEKLYQEMYTADYWLYPTSYCETSCITSMEMLANGVICIYYPVAGLVDTIKDYGIPVNNTNEVLECLNKLSSEPNRKNEIRQRGITYAFQDCSWSNRVNEWLKIIINSNQTVAIFNSFGFHYEMFGYILSYFAKKDKRWSIYIFTETGGNNWGWLDFYKEHFGKIGLEFVYKPLASFVQMKKHLDVIFVPTDDDYGFKRDWIDERCITIEHTPATRAPGYSHRIAVRPFEDSGKPWALPCYEIVTSPTDKMELCENNDNVVCVNIAVVGRSGKIDIQILNRIEGISKHFRIKLHCIGNWYQNIIGLKNERVEVEMHNLLLTTDLIHLLKKCDYVLTDITNPDHIDGKSMSGCIPLAFSTLTPIIIGRKNNSIYKFKSAVEFDVNSTEPIVLKKISSEIASAVALERDELIRKAHLEFEKCIDQIQRPSSSLIPKRMMQTWEHKHLSREFQEIMDTWKTHNPNYEFVLMDAEDREQFIRAHFEQSVVDAYHQIIPGAYKSDLFRYCYLWVIGGVYVDIDTLCLGKLDDFLISGAELVVPIDLNVSPNEGNHNLACGFIATIPKHPALMRCIQKIVHNVRTNTVPRSKLDFSGPGILGRAVNEYMGNDETASFVGKEVLHPLKGIYFLKFEQGTEFVKNVQNQTLFQNKNGNHLIASLYHTECCKLKDFVSWVRCASPIASNNNTQNKNIALMIYGQFRSYADNLRKNIEMLAPLFRGNRVHVFILSNKLASGNYSEQNETQIRSIFTDVGFNLCFFDYVENLDRCHSENEREVNDSYFANLKNNNGVNNDFIPKMVYRKWALNKIKNEYCKQHKIVIDLHVLGRLFDVTIKYPPKTVSHARAQKQIQYEIDKLTICSSEKLTVLGSSDSLFIGTQQPIDHLFELSTEIKNGNVRGPEIWNDLDFLDVMMRVDSHLCIHRATYSPEVQYIAHMYFSKFKYQNIRFDFNNPQSSENDSTLYDLQVDPKRYIHHP
jgi:mannosyltransferase OCH1-like enzyme/glycosyltransferase involved in cell wall biosynthesis